MTTGETERALRRATCAWCWEGLPLSEHPKEDSPVHIAPPHGYLRVERRYKCTSKHAELLPLFNAGIAGAYAAAAKAAEMAGSKVGDVIQTQGDVQTFTAGMSEAMQRIYKAILALTPADARQPQQHHDDEAQLKLLTEARRVFFCPGGSQNFINWLDKRLAAARTPDSKERP